MFNSFSAEFKTESTAASLGTQSVPWEAVDLDRFFLLWNH